MTTITASGRTAAPILRRQLQDGRRGLIGWSLGLAAVIALYLPVYPSLQTPELSSMIDSLPSDLVSTLGFDEIATGAGYVQASFFGLLGFLLAVIAGTAWGAQFIAGTEETGRLELTLAHAIGRVQYVVESTATLVVRMLVLSAVTILLVLAMNGPAELTLSAGNVVAATAAWAALATVSGTAALAVGAVTGRRTWSVGAGAAVAVLGYGLDAVGSANPDLDWISTLSPYHWAFGQAPLANGADWGGLALLLGGSALLVAVSCTALARRDISG